MTALSQPGSGRRLTIDVPILIAGFSIFLPLALSAASFPMIDLISSLHGMRDFDIERVKLVNGLHLSIIFNLVPLAALLFSWLIPITPLRPAPVSPVLHDLTETFRFLLTASLAAFTAAIMLLRLGGAINGDNAPGVVLSFFTTAMMAYAVLMPDLHKDGRPVLRSNWIIVGSLLLFCVLLSKRELVLFALPLLAVRGVRTKLSRVAAFLLAAAGTVVISGLARANLDIAQTTLRLLGDQFKFLERYATSYGVYDTCFGPATLLPFVNRGHYAEFYQYTRDPITLAPGGSPIYWDSSSLLERLNFAFCSDSASLLIYFTALMLLLLMEKKLRDGRFLRAALILILFSFESFAFYNQPSLVILAVLAVTGFWKIISTLSSSNALQNGPTQT